ncbi:MAG: inorganic phosphate transporter [Candidatus Thermoplasmatota archaeon]
MIDLILLFALAASIFMGISIGASSVPPAFGPVSSSGASGILKSALIAGIAASLGAIIQGGSVTNTIGSGIIFGEIQELQAFSILFIASILVIGSVITKYPMPTAFTVVGAVVGSAFSFGNGVQWSSLRDIVGYWLIIPFLAIGISYSLAKVLRYYLSKKKSKKSIRYLTLSMGLLVAYTSGANSVGLAVGPLSSVGFPIILLLIIGSVSILVGAWTFSPKIIDAVSFEYSNVGPRRSAAALGTAALLAEIGILLGIPISFSEAIIASVIGSGLVVGKANIGKRKIAFTTGGWIGAFFLSGILTFLLGTVLQYVVG